VASLALENFAEFILAKTPEWMEVYSRTCARLVEKRGAVKKDKFQKKAFISIEGKGVKVFFSVLFSEEDMAPLLVNAPLREDVSSFMSEYCNLVAGRIKEYLSAGVEGVGIGLPKVDRVDTKPFNTRYDSQGEQAWKMDVSTHLHKKYKFWKMRVSDKNGIMKCEFLIYADDPDSFSSVLENEHQMSGAGDIVFF
jgi:hypothetical protein